VGRRFRFARGLVAVAAAAAMLVPLMPAAVYAEDADVLVDPKGILTDEEDAPPPSGIYDFRDVSVGTGLTECPQAGKGLDREPRPLDIRARDSVERLSSGGDDRRTNQDYSCFPQDETSVAINPRHSNNVLAGANDYRLGWGTSGFYASTDNGDHWYDGIIPFPSLPSGDNLDGGGDPAVVFDRGGVAYYADINFNRTDDTSGVWVSRSTNGGFTWSRPCVAIDVTPTDTTDNAAICGGPGDPRQPGDGTVVFTQDNDSALNGTVPAHDKEYIAAGPRPAGVTPVCFAPITRTPTDCAEGIVGPDRVYVTWSIFTDVDVRIYFSYSDDRAHSWSAPKAISGSASFCAFGATTNACDVNQYSVPTVNPATGFLYVAFENFNTPDENQYVGVRSYDGGQTFQGPFFITPLFDVNYPQAGVNRSDCAPMRGQQPGRRVLTNSCFRVNAAGNVVADRRGGAFADDLYLVIADNRNGQRLNTNTDVFLFTSKDGGATWIGPTRVNNDPSRQPTIAEGTRDCGRIVGRVCPSSPPTFGNDQWFPWIDVSDKGDLNVVFSDRRLDTNSTAGEWPTSRTPPNGRPGNYLVWHFGAQCSITSTATVTATTTTIPVGARQCLGSEAAVIAQPAEPINPPSGAVIPGGAETAFRFRNFNVSDTTSNFDYGFRAGIFLGDYNGVTVGRDRTAWTVWTDARNGRSSRNEAGRNPICEQSDAFNDRYSAQNGGTVRTSATQGMNSFLVTDCPLAMQDRGARGDGGGGD
jgi:hypothetical protein